MFPPISGVIFTITVSVSLQFLLLLLLYIVYSIPSAISKIKDQRSMVITSIVPDVELCKSNEDVQKERRVNKEDG